MVPQNRTRQLPSLCIQLHAAVRIGFGPHPLGLRIQLHFIGSQSLRTVRQLHIAHGPEGSIVIAPGAIASQTAVLHAQQHPANQPLHIGLRTVPKDDVRLQNLDANGFAFLRCCNRGSSPGQPQKEGEQAILMRTSEIHRLQVPSKYPYSYLCTPF